MTRLFTYFALVLGVFCSAIVWAAPNPPVLLGGVPSAPQPTGDYPAYWQDIPLTPYERMVAAGKSCGSSDVACPTSCSGIASAVQNQNIQYVLPRGDEGGGPADGIYDCGPASGGSHGPAFPNTVDGQLIGPYNSEFVWLRMGDTPESWDNVATQTPSGSQRNQPGFLISGDNVTVQGFKLGPFELPAVVVNANDVNVIGNWGYGSWKGGFIRVGYSSYAEPGQAIDRALVLGNACVFSRHGSCFGIHVGELTPNFWTRDAVFKQNACYGSGFDTDGHKVYSISGDNPSDPTGYVRPSAPYDQAGGGNSDCYTVANRNCEQGGNRSYCEGYQVYDSFAVKMADDGLDVSFRGRAGGPKSRALRNQFMDIGPEGNRGFKIKDSESLDYVLAGNILIGSLVPQLYWAGGPTGSMKRGIEYRVGTNGEAWGGNNTIVGMSETSKVATVADGGSITLVNDLQLNNGTDAGGGQSDWNTSDGNAGVSPACARGFSDTMDLSPLFDDPAWLADPLQQHWMLMGQAIAACAPQPGSALIDAGTFDPDIHCARADDDPQATQLDLRDQTCMHWRGEAPDIGAVESQ